VTIESTEPGRPGLTVFGEARLPGVRAAERFSIVMLAGREAERLYSAEPLPEGSDADDLKGVKLTLRDAGGRADIEQPDGSFITFEEFLPERIERLRRRTRPLVRDPVVRWRIHRVRDALLAHGTLTDAELAKILAQ
jgi:hypothetical protein